MTNSLHESRHDHRRLSCDDLLASTDFNNSDNEEPVDSRGILGRPSGFRSEAASNIRRRQAASVQRKAFFVRSLALFCACCLSIGSHYASYILGPLKSRLSRELGASHTEFSLMISAFSLNSTWTPLVGGLLASKFGTTVTSILATGVILLGQVLLLFGEMLGSLRLMTLGLFVFGLAVSPLAVIQETIIVRFFKSHGLGVSLALGLLAGKGASFISARTSYPLTEHFGTRAPFYVATGLAALSFLVNLLYVVTSKWFVDGACAELEASDIKDEARRRSVINMTESQALEKVAEKKRVNFRDIAKFGDVFWAYVGLNVLCGTIWAPFTHLSANLIETRYGLGERDAANTASYLLAGSIFLYPICGFLVDRYKQRPIVVQLLLLSSILTLFAYVWLAIPPTWTQTPIPAVLSFAIGHGFSPLLLVVLVPKIVSLKYVSTALGVHKSLEQAGSVIMQTLVGLILDWHKRGESQNPAVLQHVITAFLVLNIAQFITILGLAYLQRKKDLAVDAAIKAGVDSNSVSPTEEDPLMAAPNPHRRYESTASQIRSAVSDQLKTRQEIRRGGVFATASVLVIVFTWVMFMGTAYFRLGMKKHH
ncbi:hypothetical protein D9758_000272 [Tetrapyrgos nigripes]|uniref:Lysosomal dipeptide transporter MFSD1 n=1 Tax=Tetrapyrgos nigripes TaxID=182062 RepID=A0A8H5H125_9AGAR|nr:hypothetical protein D9758_000272 [Tetrapyrgos nigripes]